VLQVHVLSVTDMENKRGQTSLLMAESFGRVCWDGIVDRLDALKARCIMRLGGVPKWRFGQWAAASWGPQAAAGCGTGARNSAAVHWDSVAAACTDGCEPSISTFQGHFWRNVAA